ncbi:MAG: hypothetical protein Q8K98_02310 [Bacteroidota bacterium]|nr:hypothetical protein [Bacteroidota bacterium]
MNKQNHLEVLEEKLISNLDFIFLQKIKEKLPYCNAYFLVCLIEVLNRFIDDKNYYKTFDDTIEAVIEKASELYLTTNISSIFEIETGLVSTNQEKPLNQQSRN